MFSIITSKKDIAGTNIKKALLKKYQFKKTSELFNNNPVYKFKNIKLYTTNKQIIYLNNIDKKIKSNLFIFTTKHESQKKVKSLCIHPIGNWNKAELGGKEKTLCIAPACYIKQTFIELTKNNNLNYNSTLEATHHGPFLNKPSFFIEIGSSKKQWQDQKAAQIIAKTIINSLNKKIKIYKTALLLGGTHYNSTSNKITLRTNFAIGHICPKHNLKHLNKKILLQALKKIKPEPSLIILEWKGLGKSKQKIINLLKQLKLNWKKSKEILS